MGEAGSPAALRGRGLRLVSAPGTGARRVPVRRSLRGSGQARERGLYLLAQRHFKTRPCDLGLLYGFGNSERDDPDHEELQSLKRLAQAFLRGPGSAQVTFFILMNPAGAPMDTMREHLERSRRR